MNRDEQETQKQIGWDKFYKGKSVEEQMEGLLMVIEAHWWRDGRPVALEEFTRHWLYANGDRWPGDAIDNLRVKYPPPEKPMMGKGRSNWDTYGKDAPAILQVGDLFDFFSSLPSGSVADTESSPQPQFPGLTRELRVFLCHAKGDKSKVRDLYRRLKTDGWIDPWLDEEKILPGQDWDYEISNAIRQSDVVIVCLSHTSITKEGYVQKEIVDALEIAKQKPEGTIYIIPLKLEECEVPKRLERWQWVNLYEANGYQRLRRSLQARSYSTIYKP